VVANYWTYRYRLFLVAAIIGGGASLAIAQGKSSTSVSQAALGAEVPFLTENNTAMQTMMANMTVKPTGDVDRDFVAMMTPHHQGAIDMAQAELLYGHNEKLLRVSQEIIAEQLQEIAAMRLAIGEPASPTWVTDAPVSTSDAQPVAGTSVKSEAAFLAQNDAAMNKMMAGMAAKPTGDVDHDFVAMMVPHHQGAIDMAQAELRYGHNQQLKTIAQEIIVDQIKEIQFMRLALGEPLPPSIASPTQTPLVPSGPPAASPQASMQMSPAAMNAMQMSSGSMNMNPTSNANSK
jgi:uncharacterized protein (DUF305 family)